MLQTSAAVVTIWNKKWELFNLFSSGIISTCRDELQNSCGLFLNAPRHMIWVWHLKLTWSVVMFFVFLI